MLKAAVYGMQRGLLNLGFSLGPLVGGGTYETSRGRLSELDTSSDSRFSSPVLLFHAFTC